MKNIDQLDEATAKNLRGVLFDLDDTLLDGSALSEWAFHALHQLASSGLMLLAVTGRPAGYGEVLVPQWPIEGLIAENGSIAVLKSEGRLELLDEAADATRRERRERLRALVRDLQQEYPALVPAADVHLRRCDFTFDIGEFHRLDPQLVAKAIDFAHQRGATTVRSSVHLHVSYDGSDKASGTIRVLSQRFGFDTTRARAQFAFIGDSENDEAGFAAFDTSVAVANLRGRPTISPRYMTTAARGQGFAEFAARVVTLRQ